MKKNIVIAVSILLPFITNSQTVFQKTLCNDSISYFNHISSTSDGGFIATGASNYPGAGNYDIFLAKLTADGSVEWIRTYGTTDFDNACEVHQTTDNGYIIAGWTNVDDDILIIKTNAMGDTLWTGKYGGSGGENPFSIRQTDDDGYIISAQTNTYSTGGSNDIYLLKLSSAGDLQWAKAYGISGMNDWAGDAKQTSDGGFIISGSVGLGTYTDACLIKTNGSGDTLWTRYYGSNDFDYGEDVSETADGGFLLGGTTMGFGSGGSDFYLVKTDSAGNEQWSKTLGSANDEELSAITEVQAGGFILAGICHFSGQENMIAFRLDNVFDSLFFDTLWSKTYGGPDDDECISVCQAQDGGFLLGGYTISFGTGTPCAYFVKTDWNGNSGCNESIFQTTIGNPVTLVHSGMITGAGGTKGMVALQTGTPSFSSTTLCTASFINNHPENPGLRIWPLPAADFVNLATGEPGTELSVYSIEGQEVLSMKLTEKVNIIDIRTLGAGMYIVRIQTTSGIVAGKIVVER